MNKDHHTMNRTTLLAAAALLLSFGAAQAQTPTGANAGIMQNFGFAQQSNAGSFGSPRVSSSKQVAIGETSYQASTLGNPANGYVNTVQASGKTTLKVFGFSVEGGAGSSGAQGGFSVQSMTNPGVFTSGFPAIGQ